MVDYSEFMNKPLGEMKRLTLPPGHYFGRVKGYEAKESSQSKKPMLSVQFTLDSAGEDVDVSGLPEQGVNGKTVTANFMMDTDFGQDDIRKFITACVPNTDPAQGWGQYLAATANQPVKLYIENRRRDKDDPNSELTEDIKKVLPVEG